MRTAVAISEHPLATHAVGECVGRILEIGGEAPDLLAVFTTQAQLGALEDVVRATRQLLRPATTIGAGLESVMADTREVERHGALSMFALWSDDPGGAPRARSFRLRTSGSPEGPELLGASGLRGATGTLLVLTDPFSTPSEALLDQLERVAPLLQVVGGGASAGRAPGGNVLVLDGQLHRDGAVAVLLPDTIPVHPIVAGSTRPLGDTFTVTATEDELITGLGGRSPIERLEELLVSLSPEERGVAVANLHLGRILDHDDPDGHVHVLQLLGIDRGRRGLAVAGQVEVGESVRFELRSPDAATASLRDRIRGRRGTGGLVLSCTERGHSWFGEPDHDAAILSEELGVPLGGGFFAGQIAPLAARPLGHRGSLVVALFG